MWKNSYAVQTGRCDIGGTLIKPNPRFNLVDSFLVAALVYISSTDAEQFANVMIYFSGAAVILNPGAG